jgi:sulfur-oxidizing protein SoxZ
MTEPTRIRAQLAGDKAVVRFRMAHEMESGQRKDGNGKPIAAWFIQEVTVAHNGKPVLTLQCGPSVSKNPFVQFTLKGAKIGDKLAVAWTDSRGETRSDEAAITA